MNSDGWRIQASRGIIRLTGCLVDDMETIMEYPDMIWVFPPDAQAISLLVAIEIGDYRVSLDHERATIHHHGSHDDPLFMITHSGTVCAEINLYRPLLAEHDCARVTFIDGRTQVIHIDKNCPPPVDAPALETSLTGWPHGTRLLQIKAPDGAELIWQIAEFGRFHEERILLPAGYHNIPVPNFFADWLGIVISTRNLERPVEHKYMASGNLGAASARWLLDATTSTILAPPQARRFSFRPLCVYLEHPAPPGIDALLDDFHEILFCIPLTMEGWQPDTTKPYRIIMWGDIDDPGIAAADWVRLPPDCAADDKRLNRLRPDQRRSYALFCDADAADFPQRLAAAVAARPIMATHPEQWLDFAWLSAHHDPDYAQQPGQNFYGIGFSFPRMHKWYGPEAWHRMRITETTRFLRQSSPCHNCQPFNVAACRQMLPRPGPLWWPPQPIIDVSGAFCFSCLRCEIETSTSSQVMV